MGQLTDMYNKYRKINVEKSVRNALSKTSENYIDLVKDQLLHGLASNGQYIGEYANEAYAFEKHNMNPLPGLGKMDFKFTGAFYKGILMKIRSKDYSVFSIDSKAPKLERIAGNAEQIYYLMPSNMKQFSNGVFKTALIKELDI